VLEGGAYLRSAMKSGNSVRAKIALAPAGQNHGVFNRSQQRLVNPGIRHSQAAALDL